MRQLDTMEFRKEIEQGRGLSLVDFNATWCGPCKMQHPILEELSNEVDYGIYGVDVDQAPEVAADYNVNAIPTLIVFKDGVVKETLVGFQSKDVLEQLMDSYL